MSRKRIIGVMGTAENHGPSLEAAYAIGKAIAEAGWATLTGGRHTGVMTEALRGAREAGGLTIGILPDADDQHASPHADIVLPTGLGSARNNLNVLSSDIVIAIALIPSAGTLSEIALAAKARKTTLVLTDDKALIGLLSSFSSDVEIMMHYSELIKNLLRYVRKGVF